MTEITQIWLGMVVSCAVTPLVLMIFGWRFLKKPPQKINRYYGYRTKRSMKNQDTWMYAHKCCGELWIAMGRWLLPLTLGAMLLSYYGGEAAILAVGGVIMVVDVAVAFWTYYKVEEQLKSAFDEMGQRRA